MNQTGTIALLLVACACRAPVSADAVDLLAQPDQAALHDLSATPDLLALTDQTIGCRPDKMAFSRERGCENDGSVEFCLPAGDDALLARVQAIAPSVRCAVGGGRARCDTQRELLCLFPTGMAECLGRHGALTDEAWARLCALSVLPEIRRIVPTWFE